MHRSVVRLFGDCPDATVAPLSIHKLVSIADEVLGRHPGDWFGPSSTAHLLKEGVDRSGHPMLDSMCVYVARDCTVYRQDVRDICRRHREKRRPRRQMSNQQHRRGRNRNNNSVSPAVAVEEEGDFSLLQVPEDIPIAGGTGGVVEGVPYVVEAEEAEEDMAGFRVVANRKQEARLCKSARGGTGKFMNMGNLLYSSSFVHYPL